MKKTLFIAVLGLVIVPLISSANFDVNLKYGMRSQGVSDLQELLVSENCLSTSPTSYFGLLTLKGVKCLQTKYGISPVSGYFGNLTRAKANELVANITTESDQAETQETGTTVAIAPCINGAKFNTSTGQLCQADNNTLLTQITQLQQQVESLQTTVQTPVVQPPVNLGSATTPQPTYINIVDQNVNPRGFTCRAPESMTTIGMPLVGFRLGDIILDLYSSSPTISEISYSLEMSGLDATTTKSGSFEGYLTGSLGVSDSLANMVNKGIIVKHPSNPASVLKPNTNSNSKLGMSFVISSVPKPPTDISSHFILNSVKFVDGGEIRGLPIDFGTLTLDHNPCL